MNDLSLGRLRIANPDENSPETSLEPQTSDVAVPAVSPLPTVNGDNATRDYLGHVPPPGQTDVSPLPEPISDHELEPVRTPPALYPSSPPQHQDTTYFPQRTEYSSPRSNMSLNYQDQQQAQFPKYPSMMPQHMGDRGNNTQRPGSMYYMNLPVNTSGNGITRQSSYRSREGSGTSTPQRSSSRRLPQMASQSREDLYNDNRPRQSSHPPLASTANNGALPQRTSSRHMQSSRMGSVPPNTGPLSSTPISTNTPLSASPYQVEGHLTQSNEDWNERGAAISVKREYDSNGQPVLKSVKKGVRDFNFGATLGEGSYSTVLAAQDRQTQKDYAIKVLDKRHIIKEKKVKYVNIEKETLNRLTDHPGVVRLYYTFQDERSLYFVLDLCSGGELLGTLKRMSTFDEECTRFYSAQILDTIEYMHKKGVIHRDLKPENVLMDDNRYIKITDFGTAKMLKEHKNSSGHIYYDADSSHIDDRANSFVGTAEYVSPELLTDKNACKASDLWAFGCIVYQLLAGRPPFKAANEYLTFQKIVALEYDFPRGFPEVARDLVERLLVLDPTRRLTLDNIKVHPFFTGIQWGRALWQMKAPRLKAYVPPPTAPIKLNGAANNDMMTPSHSAAPTMLPPANASKPAKPRVITELPPPTELDIEWSPVLTRSNERILKLGNLVVNMSQGPNSPESGSKLSRFFGGNTTKKRQRLVMVTSSARVIIVAAGGEEKKSKSEINLLAPGCEIQSSTDSKGTTHWVISTREKHYTFEDVKGVSSTESNTSAVSTQEWMDAIERAKDIVNTQALMGNNTATDEFAPGVLSHGNTMEQQESDNSPMHGLGHSGRGVLQKQGVSGDNESMKGRKRFSKRQSKSGLTAVF